MELADAWSWLNSGALAPDPTLAAEQLADPDHDYRAKVIRDVFRSEAGRAALETLAKLTVGRAPVDHRYPTETEYLRYAQLRQGQNQVFAAILAYIRHAEQLETKPHAPAPVSDDAPDLRAGGAAGRRSGDAAAGGPGDDPASWLTFLDTENDAAVTG